MAKRRKRFAIISLASGLLAAGAAMAASTTYSYDVLGRVIGASDTFSGETTYAYDPVNNRTSRVASSAPASSDRVHPNAAGTAVVDTSGLTVVINNTVSVVSDAGAPPAFPYVWSTSATNDTVRIVTGNSGLATVSYAGWASPSVVGSLSGILTEARSPILNSVPILSMNINPNKHPRVSGFGVAALIVDTTTTLASGQWFFWAVTVGPDPANAGRYRCTLYVDGVQKGQVTNLVQRDLGATRIISAANDTSDAPAGNGLRGLQQEWRIYAGVELTSTQVAALYAKTRSGL